MRVHMANGESLPHNEASSWETFLHLLINHRFITLGFNQHTRTKFKELQEITIEVTTNCPMKHAKNNITHPQNSKKLRKLHDIGPRK